jgi:two-component system KDP operon response regulator KdpE
MSSRILVIDDEPQVRKFLRIALTSQGYVVSESGDGRAGLAELAACGADAVVLDLGLPDLDGLDVLREIRRWSRVPVIVLSVRADEAQKVRALDAGANDYVTKPFGIQELMARVRGLLRRRGADEGERYDDGHVRIDIGARSVEVDRVQVNLSRKEFAVLATLLRESGKVVTQQQLLREHWGPEHEKDTHYLRILVGKLRQKLGDNATEPRYLRTEPGVGYRFLGVAS